MPKDPEVEKRRLRRWYKNFRERKLRIGRFFREPLEFEESLSSRAKGKTEKEVDNA